MRLSGHRRGGYRLGGYRVRTSGASLAAICLAGIYGAQVINGHSVWRGDLLWSLQQLGSGLFFVLPLILVLISMPPVLRGGAEAERSLLATRPARQRWLRWAVDTAVLVSCHLLFVGYVFVLTLVHHSEIGLSVWVTLAIQFAAIALVAALGRAIGEVSRHPGGILLAAACGVVLVGYNEGVLRLSAGNSPYAGLRLDYGAYWVSIAVVSCCCLLLVAMPRSFPSGPVTIGVALVGLLVAADSLGEPDLVTTGYASTTCARSGGVDICVFPGYQHMLPHLVSQTDRAMVALHRAGVDAHVRRVMQAAPGAREDRGVVTVHFDEGSLRAGRTADWEVQSAILHPSWCPQLSSPTPPPAGFDRAQEQSFYWFQHISGDLSDRLYAELLPKFSARTSVEQARAVQGFLDANLECRGLG